MFRILEKYKEKGQFEFKQSDRLSKVCNAPGRDSGIYIIYADVIDEKNLIYIGISGKESVNGEIIHRDDGLGGRIVNGKQFGKGRRRSCRVRCRKIILVFLILNGMLLMGLLIKIFQDRWRNHF